MLTLNKIGKHTVALIAMLFLFGELFTLSGQETGSFTDSRDDSTYYWVKIGDQTWMSENLAYLPQVDTVTGGSEDIPEGKYYYVYDFTPLEGNDETTQVSNAKATVNYQTYGVLYNWYAAMDGYSSSATNPSRVQGVCPDGWHLPGDAEWSELETWLTDNGYGYEGSGSDIGKALAATSGWVIDGTPGNVGNDQASNNSSGFSAFPGGNRDGGGFISIGEYDHWWSSTELDADNSRDRYLGYANDMLGNDSNGKMYGFPVRCVRDIDYLSSLTISGEAGFDNIPELTGDTVQTIYLKNTGSTDLVIDSISSMFQPFSRTVTLNPIPTGDSLAVNISLNTEVLPGSYSDSLVIYLGMQDTTIYIDATISMGAFSFINTGLQNVTNSSVAWGDYDNDGDLDLLLTGNTGGEYFSGIYRNDTDTLIDINAALSDVAFSSVAWGDYDNDGDLDILLSGDVEGGEFVSKIYQNDNGSFTDINAPLVGVYNCSTDWGDYDNDGDLDILLSGSSEVEGEISRVYRNDTGSFVNINAGLAGIHVGSVEWGDYDRDGDLDILLTGDWPGHGFVSIIYQNNNGAFTDINAALSDVAFSSVAWGDWDNDGDLDILLTGDFGVEISKIYQNNNGTFTDINAVLTGVINSSVAWGDWDNDGDLDILLSGQTAGGGSVSDVYRNDNGTFSSINVLCTGAAQGSAAWGDWDNDGDLDILITGDSGNGVISKLYRNNSLTANTPPATPSGLSMINTGEVLEFFWDASSDNETPVDGLNYSLYLIEDNTDTLLMPPADITTGYNRLSERGIVQGTSKQYANPGKGTYTWGVQAVDAAFAGSAFATANFTIDNQAPGTPQPDSPQNGDNVFADSVCLDWNSTEYDGDTIFYNIRCGVEGDMHLIADTITEDTLIARNLIPGEKYYWQVTAFDKYGASTTGDLWYFFVAITETEPNNDFSTSNCSGNGNGFYGSVGNVTDAADYFCISYPYNGLFSITVQNLNSYGISNGGLSTVNIYNYQYNQINYINDNYIDAGETASSSQVLLNANETYYIRIAAEIIDDNVPYRLSFNVDTSYIYPDDNFESNNTMETAYPMCQDSIYSVVGYNGDREDWYAVSFNDTGTFTVRVSDPNDSYTIFQDEGLGLGTVRIYSPSGSEITSIDQWQVQNGSTGEISPIEVSAGQTYYIEISTYNTATAAAYSLKIVSDVQELCAGWKPAMPAPVNIANGEKAVLPGDTTLIWQSSHPEGEEITYDLYLGETNPPSLVATGLTQAEWDIHSIELNDTIYWKVVANAGGNSTASGIYWFASCLYSETDTDLPEERGSRSTIDWGDYDNDNDLDLLYASQGSTRIYRNNGEGNLIEMDVGLVNLERYGSADWGDYDNDGDLDILLSGLYYNNGEQLIAKIYRNDGDNSFIDINAGLTGVDCSGVKWGDYDSDGDLDILLSGRYQSDSELYTALIYRNNGNDTFSEIDCGLPGVYLGSVDWGDYDRDGDLDILLAGSARDIGSISRVYRNDGSNSFVDINAGLYGISRGNASWGDYDNDGYLDIIVAGDGNTRIYRNSSGNGTFNELTSYIIGISDGGVAWGDCDNDGDKDILITGADCNNGCIGETRLYQNNGASNFTDLNAGIIGLREDSRVSWADYNNDKKLDFLVSGYVDNFGHITKIYQNNAREQNTVPQAPSVFNVRLTDGGLEFYWEGVTGDETATAGLSYNLCLTGPTGDFVVSPMADTLTGYRRIVERGMIQGTSWVLDTTNMAYGEYSSMVQAIDAAYAGGEWSERITFTLSDNPFPTLALGEPANNIYDVDTLNTVLTWSGSDPEGEAISYNVYFGTEADPPLLSETQLDTFYVLLTLQSSTKYYWRVEVIDAFGNITKRSIRSFTTWTNDAPEITSLQPENNANETGINVDLQWTASDDEGEAISYDIYFGRNNPPELVLAGFADTIIHIDTLSYGVSYYWQVIANDGFNITESGIRSFSTGLNDAPVLLLRAPANDSIGVPLTIELDWSATDDEGEEISYDIFFGTTNPPELVHTAYTSDSLIIDTLDWQTTFYWKIIAHDIYGNITESSVNTFSTTTNQAPQITIQQPLNNAINVGLPSDLMWTIFNDDNDSFSYEIYFGSDNNPPLIESGDTVNGNFAITVDTLKLSTSYYWEVTATDQYTNSSTSGIISFTTGASFSDISATIPGVSSGEADWGDYDGDGDLDLLFSGSGAAGIYRNDGNGSFTDINRSLLAQSNCTGKWGDYDNDGDLDFMYVVPSNAPGHINIYRNDGADNFNPIAFTIYGESMSADWGDYDNDGDLDIVSFAYDDNTNVCAIYQNLGNDIFVDTVYFPLFYIESGALEWVDFDSDGDLDIFYCGSRETMPYSVAYRNEGGNDFDEVNLGIPVIGWGDFDWGDYDNDGDLDFLITGSKEDGPDIQYLTEIYNNSNGVISKIDAVLHDLQNGNVLWGDTDNDGDLDVLISGYIGGAEGESITKLYENRGGDAFIESNVVLEGYQDPILSFMDYDNDNDLDLFVAGNKYNYGNVSRIYSNNTLTPNTPPQLPVGLSVISSEGYTSFSWDACTDAETSAAGLSYNMFIKDVSGAYVVSPDADTITGYHRLSGRGRVKGTSMAYLLPRGTYRFGVQAIDASFAGGQFSKSTLSIANNSPTKPLAVYPESGVSVFSESLYLKWGSEDIDGDTVSYDVWFGPAEDLSLVADDIAIDSVQVSGLQSGAEYQWFIEAKDDMGATTTGDTWSFMVANIETEPNNDFSTSNCSGNGNGFYGSVGNVTDAADYFCISYPYNGLFSITVQNLNSYGISNGGLSTVNIYNYQYNQINYINDNYIDAGETASSSQVLLNANETYYIRIAAEIIDDNVPYRLSFNVDTSYIYPDDNFESNNTMETAYPMCQDSIYSVVGYNGDREDWYAVSFNDTGTFTVRVSDPNDSYTIFQDEGLGLGTVRIYSPSGSEITSIDQWQVQNGSTGEISPIEVSAGQTYYIEISTYNTATAAAYSLKIVSDVQELCAGWKPAMPAPVNIANGETSVLPGDTTLIWQSSHPEGEEITYDLYLGETNPPSLVATGLTQAEWDIHSIELNDTIYWKVVASAGGNSTASGIYWFTSSLYSETEFSLNRGSQSTIDWGDYDNDNDLDLLYATQGSTRIYRNNGEGNLIEMDVGLVNLEGYGSADWGDYDNDGDLDILLSGYYYNNGKQLIAKVYRNDGDNSFIDINAGLTGVNYSGVKWGDYDSDGDLDILLSGRYQSDSELYTALIYRNNGNDTFSEIDCGLPGVHVGSVDWGDYDRDGDIDILLAGNNQDIGSISRVYRNDGSNSFVDINAGLNGTSNGNASWGDYDNDGYLDIIVAGEGNTRIYRNSSGNGTFNELTSYIIGIHDGGVAWGDCDNDGDKDILITGVDCNNGCIGETRLYQNNGTSNFTDLNAGIIGLSDGSRVSWVDYNNDKKLDFLVSGHLDNFGHITKIYRNNSLVKNSPPSVPSALNVRSVEGGIEFYWEGVTGDETATAGLSYNLCLTGPDGSFVVSPMADTLTGYRRIVERGMIQGTSWVLDTTNLVHGQYGWMVQAIDASYAGGVWSEKQGFILSDNPILTLTICEPANKAYDLDTVNVTLVWSSTVTEGESITYDVYFGTTTDPPLYSEALTDTFYILPILQSATKYYWRVEGKDAYGNVIKGSTRSFTTWTNDAPEITLLQPSDYSTDIAPDVILKWSATDDENDVMSYDIFFSTDNPPVELQTGYTDTTYVITGLAKNITYYWKVIAIDSYGNTTESDLSRFTVTNKATGWIELNVTDATYTGLADVLFSVGINILFSGTTDANGKAGPFILVTGTHPVNVKKAGYFNYFTNSIEVTEDDTTIANIILPPIGDYNSDDDIDQADIDSLIIKWREEDFCYELGPATGYAPDFTVMPDSVLNFEDLMIFGMIWDYYNISAKSCIVSSSNIETGYVTNNGWSVSCLVDEEITSGRVNFNFTLTGKGNFISNNLVIKYDNSTLQYQGNRVLLTSDYSGVSFVNNYPEKGFLEICTGILEDNYIQGKEDLVVVSFEKIGDNYNTPLASYEVHTKKSGKEIGIVEFNSASNITIYPNPASDMVIVDIHNSNVPAILKVISSTGRILILKELTGSVEDIDISGLKSGILIFIVTTNGKVYSKVIVKTTRNQ